MFVFQRWELCLQWERESLGRNGMWRREDSSKYSRDILELSSGEGIAIGDRPCKFHMEDVYVYDSSS